MRQVRSAVGVVMAAALVAAMAPNAALAEQPTIESESVSNVTSGGATLEARLNTEEIEGGGGLIAEADFQFDIAQTPGELPAEFTCPFPHGSSLCLSMPERQGSLPFRSLAAGQAEKLVTEHVGLSPNTTYYYRLVAAQAVMGFDVFEWVKPAVQGPILSFTTPPPPEPPGVATAGASATGPTTAIVDGSVEPNGEATTVHADYALASEPWCASHGAEGAPSATAPTELGVLHGVVSEVVVKLEDLTPNRGYCAELVAQNETGAAFGAQVSFTTPPLIEKAEYMNWVLSGAITDKKQREAITLPTGATFDGSAEVNVETGAGSVTGNLAIPPLGAEVNLFGVLPLHLGITIAEVGQLEGTLAESQTVPGDESLTIPLTLNVGVTSFNALGLMFEPGCTTTESATLLLSDTLSREELLSKGWSFSGTTRLPRFKCEGQFGQLLAFVLDVLLSGPENPYSFRIAAP